MRMRMHVDERGAAFFALGYARATKRPAVWITTSGTAVANGFPAVVEASIDGVPLILLTADRPPELRDAAANQAIDQSSFFGSYARWSVDIPVPDPVVDPAFVLSTVDQAVYRATGLNPGPVHLNAMFRRPLEPRTESAIFGDAPGIQAWAAGRSPHTRYARPALRPDAGPLVEELRKAERPLIVAGRMDTDEADAVLGLAGKTGWPVAADVTSQLLLGNGSVLRYTDLIATHAEGLPVPDAVLEFGRPGVSAQFRDFLGECRPRVHAVIAERPDRIDPEHRSTHRLEGFHGSVEALTAGTFPTTGDWADPWREADGRIAAMLEEMLTGNDLSEPAVAGVVSSLIPGDHGLWLANSMPIRDMNAFATAGIRPRMVGANRGASGIDGTVASIAGFATGLGSAVTALVGDLAFLHDLNALALLRDLPVTVVLLNNDGGGIFSFLPIAEHTELFEPWFTAPHGLTFRASAEQFGLEWQAPATQGEFRSAYGHAITSGRAGVIEVRTTRDSNRRMHDDIRAEAGRRLGMR